MTNMTQKVLYSTKTAQVLQWQDTEKFGYPDPPSGTDALVVTTDEWSNQAGAWYVVNGALTQTNPNAPTAAQLLAQAQAARSATIRQDFLSAVQSAPITINGTDYQIDLAGPNATGNLASASASQILIMRNPQWAASTAVTAMQSFAAVAESLLICSTSGTTGTTAPAPPTAFGTPVADGTAEWELYGRTFDLVGGGTVTLTAQEIITATMQIEAYIHAMKQQRNALLAQIQAAQTVSAVQAVVWP